MQKRILLFLLTVSNLVLSSQANANARAKEPQKFNNQRPALFYENKGQVVDQNRNLRNDVRMIFDAPGFKLVLRDGGMSYELIATHIYQKQAKDELFEMEVEAFKNKHLQDSIIYESQRIDVEFVNANPNPKLIKEAKSDYYENYYTEYTGEQGVIEIYGYSKVTLKDVWKNIDIEYIIDSKNSNAIKYNFIVRPNGNIKDIQLKYNGLVPTLLNNSLQIITDYGEIEETIPAVYYKENTESVKPEVYYELNNGIISFSGKNINISNSILVIDPNVIWGTYYGGTGNDFGDDITTKDSGFAYIAGYTRSSSGIASSGAYKTSLTGNGDDAFIAKFTNLGKRIWATYYGGTSVDISTAIVADNLGNIYITGSTNSNSGIATIGAFQTSLKGQEDIFIAKFTIKGTRIWGTYYGGTNADLSSEMTIDDSNNIYIIGVTYSTSNIATSGTYQTNHGNGGNRLNALIAKFSTGGNRVWGTYFGSYGTERGQGIAIDYLGDIYIAGYTTSDTGIATKGAYDTLFEGTSDGFLARFSNNGNIKWATYIGAGKEDYLYTICLDSSNVYIAGSTSSDSGLATQGAFKTNYIYYYDAFISKYSKSGNSVWTSYFGDSSYEFITNICIDNFGDLYVSGTTNSNARIATNGAYQTFFGGKEDVFLAKFSNNSTLQWATYYGGSEEDFAGGMEINGDSSLYITGYTLSNSLISTSGAFNASYSSSADAYLVKFFLYTSNDAGISKVVSPDTIICSGTNAIQVVLHNYDSDSLIIDSIFWKVNNIQQTPLLWTGNIKKYDSAIVSLGYYNFFGPGKYTIIAWSSHPNGMKDPILWNDTAIASIKVKASNSISKNVSICQGNVYSFAGQKLSVTGVYYDSLKNKNGCDSIITLTLNVLSPTSAVLNSSICQGDTFKLNGQNITTAGTYYDTIVNVGGCDSTITLNLSILSTSSSKLYKSICQGTVYMFGGDSLLYAGTYFDTLSNSLGCDSIITLHLIVLQTSASTVNKTLCKGDIYNFGGNNISTSGTYYHTFTNNDGCDSVVTLNITVHPIPVTPKVSGSPTSFCEGDSVILSAGNYKNYLWSSGEKTQRIVVKNSGNYSVQVSDTGICTATSNIVSVVVFPLPQPVITNNNRTLQTGGYISYQWYLNSAKITNATNQTYTPLVNGNYQVYVTDNNGCSAMSAAFVVGWTGIAPVENTAYKLYPNPTNGEVIIEFNSVANRKLYIYDSYGRMLQAKQCVDINQKVFLADDYSAGIYLFVVMEDNISKTYKVIKE